MKNNRTSHDKVEINLLIGSDFVGLIKKKKKKTFIHALPSIFVYDIIYGFFHSHHTFFFVPSLKEKEK